MKLEIRINQFGGRFESSLEGFRGEYRGKEIERSKLVELGERTSRLYSKGCSLTDLRTLGVELFRLLLPNDRAHTFYESRDSCRRDGTELDVVLEFFLDPILHDLPWEALHDGKRFLALDPFVRLSRYMKQVGEIRPLLEGDVVRVLLSWCNAPGFARLSLDEEVQTVRDALGRSSRFHLEVLPEASFDQLRHTLCRAATRGRGFNVWHHSGHGAVKSVEGVDSFRLVFPGEPRAALVDSTTLADLVREVQGISSSLGSPPELSLGIINACSSGSAHGLATVLAGLNLPAVVGHRSPVYDHTAIAMTEGLYAALGNRRSLAACLREARSRMLATGSARDWALPILYSRTT